MERSITKKQLLVWLQRMEIIMYQNIQPFMKPTHGNCCTCQTCGYGHDECVCENNKILKSVGMLFT